MKWFEEPEIYDEKKLRAETSYLPFDYCLVNGIWVDFKSEEWELVNNIWRLK